MRDIMERQFEAERIEKIHRQERREREEEQRKLKAPEAPAQGDVLTSTPGARGTTTQTTSTEPVEPMAPPHTHRDTTGINSTSNPTRDQVTPTKQYQPSHHDFPDLTTPTKPTNFQPQISSTLNKKTIQTNKTKSTNWIPK
jgi:hypothetical protein